MRVDDEELEPYFQRQDQQRGQNRNNGRRSNQDKETRDQGKANARKGNGAQNGQYQQQQQASNAPLEQRIPKDRRRGNGPRDNPSPPSRLSTPNSTPVGVKPPAVAMPTGSNSQGQQQQMKATQSAGPSQQASSTFPSNFSSSNNRCSSTTTVDTTGNPRPPRWPRAATSTR